MSNTYQEILYQRQQADRREEAKQDRPLRIAVCIAGAIAIYWIIVPGLLNIWRG